MRLVHGVEAVRDLSEREVVDLATHVEGLPAPADGEAAAPADLVLVGRARARSGGGVDAPAAHAKRDLGLGHDEDVGRRLDALEQEAEHEEGREAAGPLGARARLQRGPEGREEGLRLLDQELVERGLDLAVEDARRRERRVVRARARSRARARARVRLLLLLLEAAEPRQRALGQAELARERVVRRVDGQRAPRHGGPRAPREPLRDGQDPARELRAAQRVGHLLRVLRLVHELVDVLARAPPQRLPLGAVPGVDADGHGRAQLQVQLVHADAHVPVLQDLGGLGDEEGRRERQRGAEARARRELDEARLRRRGGGGAVELRHIVRDEARHHLLLEVAPDEAGEQHGQEVGKLPAYDLRHLRRHLLAVLAGSLFVALHFAAIHGRGEERSA